MTVLRIGKHELERVREHARAGAPDEVCGVLVGRRDADGLHVERAIATANAHANPRTEYLVPPQELLRIVLQAEDEWGLEVVGFYHSHPAGPPHLSKTDVARASWPGAAYLLVWLAPTDDVGCWTWDAEKAEFSPLRIVS